MADLVQRGVILNQVGTELPQPHDVGDEAIQGISLRDLNITAGLSLGLLIGELGVACVRQVLNPDLGGPLGPKRESR